MNDYRRIVLAADFTDTSRVAAMRAARLAEQSKAELILLHVVEHFPEDLPLRVTGSESVKPEEFAMRRARDELKKLAVHIGQRGTRQEILVSARSAKHEIVRFAEKRDADLIVMAPNARRFLGVLGSTAAGVMHAAKCDVLAVRSGE